MEKEPFLNAIFISNRLRNEVGKGGAVVVTKGGRFTSCNFASNSVDISETSLASASMGGAVRLQSFGETTSFQDCTFTSNEARLGGAISIDH